MVSAGISSPSQTNVKVNTDFSASGKNYQTDSDFAKILTEQDKSLKTPEDLTDVSDKNTDVADRKQEVFQKLLKDGNVSQTDTKPEEEAVSCIMVQAEKFSQQIVEELSGQFNVSVEEVLTCMDALGINAADLLDKQNVSELVMELTGEENISNVLVNQSLTDTIMNIYEEVDNQRETLMDELSMTQEEFDAMLTKIDVAIETMKDDVSSSDMLISETVYDDTARESVTDISRAVQTNDNGSAESVVVENETEKLQGNPDDMNSEDGIGREDGNNQNTGSYENIMMENVIDGIMDAVNSSVSVSESGIGEKIISRILDEIKLNIRPDATSLELQLEPESLGKVNIAVTSKAGVLTAHIAAQNELAKEAIESQMSTLREAFEAQGLKVEEIEVTLASRGFEQEFDENRSSDNDNQSKTRRHISKKELDEINGIMPEEEQTLVEDVLKEMGNTVSYSA